MYVIAVIRQSTSQPRNNEYTIFYAIAIQVYGIPLAIIQRVNVPVIIATLYGTHKIARAHFRQFFNICWRTLKYGGPTIHPCVCIEGQRPCKQNRKNIIPRFAMLSYLFPISFNHVNVSQRLATHSCNALSFSLAGLYPCSAALRHEEDANSAPPFQPLKRPPAFNNHLLMFFMSHFFSFQQTGVHSYHQVLLHQYTQFFAFVCPLTFGLRLPRGLRPVPDIGGAENESLLRCIGRGA